MRPSGSANVPRKNRVPCGTPVRPLRPGSGYQTQSQPSSPTAPPLRGATDEPFMPIHRPCTSARCSSPIDHRASLLNPVGRPSASHRRTFQWLAPRFQGPACVHHLRRPVRCDLAAVPQTASPAASFSGVEATRSPGTRFSPPRAAAVHLPRQTRPNLADSQRIDPILAPQILRRRGTGVVGRARDGGRRTDRRPYRQSKPNKCRG